MAEKKDRFSFVTSHYAGQPPDTPEMEEKLRLATRQYIDTGTIPDDLPDVCVLEADGVYHSAKETSSQRISGLCGLLRNVLEMTSDQVAAAKLRCAITLLEDLPRLIDREKKRAGQPPPFGQ